MAQAARYLFFLDTDAPVAVTIDDLITAWAERLPLDVERIGDLDIGEQMLLSRLAPYVAVRRIE